MHGPDQGVEFTQRFAHALVGGLVPTGGERDASELSAEVIVHVACDASALEFETAHALRLQPAMLLAQAQDDETSHDSGDGEAAREPKGPCLPEMGRELNTHDSVRFTPAAFVIAGLDMKLVPAGLEVRVAHTPHGSGVAPVTIVPGEPITEMHALK